MNYTDQTLNCKECGNGFLFSAGEQSFFAAKGLLNEPKRCPDCRSEHRRLYNDSTPVRPARPMFEATCAKCGGSAIVPFQPRRNTPVFCSMCFDIVKAERDANTATEGAVPDTADAA